MRRSPFDRTTGAMTAPEAAPDPAAGRSGTDRYSPLLVVLAFGALGTGIRPAAAAADELTFNRHEVVIGSAKRPTVLTGFLLDGAFADLAVVRIDDGNERRLQVYSFGDDTWLPGTEVTLRPGVSFVDVADIGGRDRLVTYGRGLLSWFDPESATERALLPVTSSFNPPRADAIPHVDVTRDLNGDGRDDLVVPGLDGFRVFVQLESGTFADPVTIGPKPEMAGITGADGYRYDPWSQSRVHEIDYDRDGRIDLAFWNEDHFEVHLQDEHGLFGPLARTFTTDVAFDSDDLFSLATGDMTGRVLHSLADMNADGIADMVIFSLQGERIRRKRSAYELHLGTPTPEGGIVFARVAETTFRSDGRIQLGMDRHDLDRDGQVDLMFTAIERRHLKGSIWKRIKGFMGDDVGLDLEFYRQEGGRYAEAPEAVREIALDGPPSHREPGWVPLDVVLRGATHEARNDRKIWPRAFNNALLIGDVTGDGLSDLILGGHPRHLAVFVGVPGSDLFAHRSQGVQVDVPNDAEYTWLVDLDKDGKQEILMHHPFTLRDAHGTPLRPPGTEPHWLTILIAR